MKLLSALVFLSFSLLPLFLSASTLFNPEAYPYLFEKYGVQEKFPEINVISYNIRVLEYLKGNEEYPSDLPLDARELSHMEDVKTAASKFFLAFKTVLLVALFSLVISIYKKQDFKRPLFLAGIASVILCALLLFSALFSFDASFAFFHSLFFTGDTWLFPVGSALITLYPEGLFLDLGINTLLLAVVLSVIQIGVGKWGKPRRVLPE